ncbi:MAG: hypothetical protein RL272_162 [Candidatus Parcubacteria bacterium]
MKIRIAAAILLLGSPFIHPSLARAGGRRGGPQLRGSPSALARENAIADRYGLSRIADVAELRRFIDAGLLVPIEATDAYVLDETLGEEDHDRSSLYAHARPWVKSFLDETLGEGHRLHGDRFVLTSLVRTVTYQRLLRRDYAAAAGASGVRTRMSSHLTGSTVDIRIIGLSPESESWLRRRLIELERRGAVQATEERGSSVCFHVMVSPDYQRLAHPPPPPPRHRR